MDIIAFDPTLGSQQIAGRGATQVTLAELLARSDFVSVHCPLTKETIDLFDEAAFARMKPSAYFINTSRGRIHNQRTLLDALRAGRIAGAGLDVFDVEPLPSDHPLLQMDNVVATPHIAGGTHESPRKHGARLCRAMDRDPARPRSATAHKPSSAAAIFRAIREGPRIPAGSGRERRTLTPCLEGNTLANSFPVLADAGDCHMHFFGPPERSPGASNRAYTPYLRTEEQHWSIMRPLGFSRVAVLQPSAYHFDSRCTMDVVAGDPSRYRGVAVIPLDIANDELAAPDKAGARGIRFNIVTTGLPAGMTAALCSNRRSGWFVPSVGTCKSLHRPSRFCAVDPAVRPVWLGVAVAAPAYPVTCAPGDNLAIHVALEMVPRGSVLVIATGGGSVKSLGRYAASWIAGWPNRPSSTAALT